METIPCAWCGKPATHFCSDCGKYICDKWICKAKSAAVVVGVPETVLK